jgi:hypothetical protein
MGKDKLPMVGRPREELTRQMWEGFLSTPARFESAAGRAVCLPLGPTGRSCPGPITGSRSPEPGPGG